LLDSKIYSNGNTTTDIGAGFYSTSFSSSTIAYNTIIKGNKNYDIYSRASQWPNFGPYTSSGTYFPYVGQGYTDPNVPLFPQQYYFYAFGDFTPPIQSYYVNVPTDTPSRFYPSLSSFALSSSNYNDNPIIMNARLLYMEALEKMYDTEFEDAYNDFILFISEYSAVPELKNELRATLTLLAYIASSIEGKTEELEVFIAELDEEVFDIYINYALVKLNILSHNYGAAMIKLNEMIDMLDGEEDDTDALLLELEAAHLYLTMILENVRFASNTKYQPKSYDEFYTLEDALLKKIMNITEDKEDDPSIPIITNFTASNYPNPFNPETIISYTLPNDSNVKIEIFNIKGQKVKALLNEFTTKGHNNIIWNGQDDNGRNVGSGLYFYRIETEEHTATKKMVLLK
jgi:hypothetical protein